MSCGWIARLYLGHILTPNEKAWQARLSLSLLFPRNCAKHSGSNNIPSKRPSRPFRCGRGRDFATAFDSCILFYASNTLALKSAITRLQVDFSHSVVRYLHY